MTQAEEKALILAGDWPYYPVLPMKRHPPEQPPGTFPELGMMVAPRWNTVYLVALYQLASGGPEVLRTAPVLVYDDLDAVLAAGWHGD